MADDEFFGKTLDAPLPDDCTRGAAADSNPAPIVDSKDSVTAAAQDLKLFGDGDVGDEDPFGLDDPTCLQSSGSRKCSPFVQAFRPTLSSGPVDGMDAAGELSDRPVGLHLGSGVSGGQHGRQPSQTSATNEPEGAQVAAVTAGNAQPQSNTVMATAESERAHGPSWMELTDPAGRIYYFNERTNESRWDRPPEANSEGLVNPWEELEDGYGRAYFFNTVTEESRWTKPAEMVQEERRLALQERQAQARQQQREQEQMAEQQRRQIVEARARALTVATVTMPPRNNIAPALLGENNGAPSLLDSDSAVDASWCSSTDCEGRTYYYNVHTQESVWQRPSRLDGVRSAMEAHLSAFPTCAQRPQQRPQQQEPNHRQPQIPPGNHQQLVATDNPEDLARRNVPHCVATFGFGGLLATSTIETKQRSAFADLGARHTTVTVSLLASGCWGSDPWVATLVSSAGPLSLTTRKEELLTWLSSQRKRTGTGQEQDDAELSQGGTDPHLGEQTERLLWAYLLHLVRQDGSLHPVEAFAAQVQTIELGNSRPMPLLDSADLTLAQSRVPTDGIISDIHATTAQVERLLKDGNFKAACQCALDAEMWDVALMLAVNCVNDMWAPVATRWMQTRFQNGSLSSVLFHVVTGHTDKLADAGAREQLRKWPEILALLLRGASVEQSTSAIRSLADALYDDGQFHAAHLCYLLLGPTDVNAPGPGSRLVLVGIDGRSSITGSSRSWYRAIKMTEVYEYARALRTPGFMLPGFAKYKLQLARLQAEVGHTQRAAAYCAQLRQQCALSTSWGDGEQHVARFIGQLEALEEQLSGGATRQAQMPVWPDQYRWNLHYSQKHQDHSHYQHIHDKTQQNQSQVLSNHSFGDLGQQQVTGRRQQHEVPVSAHPLANSEPVPVVCQPQPSERRTEISSVQTPALPDKGAAQEEESGWGLSRLSSLVSTASIVSKLSKAVQGEGTAINADDMSMYFDDKLGRWIDPSTPETDEMAATAAQLAAGPSSITSVAIASSASVSRKPVDSMTVPPALRTRKRPAKKSMQTLSLHVPAHSRDATCTRGDEEVITSGAAAITVFTPTAPLEPRSQAPESQVEAATGWVEYVPEGVKEHESGSTSHVDEQTNTEQVAVLGTSAMHGMSVEGTPIDDSSGTTGKQMTSGLACSIDDAQSGQVKLCSGTILKSESESTKNVASVAVACEVNWRANIHSLSKIRTGTGEVLTTVAIAELAESEARDGSPSQSVSVNTAGTRVEEPAAVKPCRALATRKVQLDGDIQPKEVETAQAGAIARAAERLSTSAKAAYNASDDEFDPCV